MRGVLLALIMALIAATVGLIGLRYSATEPAALTSNAGNVAGESDSIFLRTNGEVEWDGAPLITFSADQYLWLDTRAYGARLVSELSSIGAREKALTIQVEEEVLVGWYLRLLDSLGAAQASPGQPRIWSELILQIGPDSVLIPDQQQLLSYPMLRLDLAGGSEYRLQISPAFLDISTVLDSERSGLMTMIYCPFDWPLNKGRALAKQLLGSQAEIRVPLHLGVGPIPEQVEHARVEPR
jgi:hypothetical protein